MTSDVVCPASLDPVCLVGTGTKGGDQNINLRSTIQRWLKRCFETTQAVVEASNLVAAGGNMKRFPVLVIVVLCIGLVQPAFAQSTQSNSSPHNSDPSIQAKQDKKVEKAKVKTAEATSKAQSGDKGKKATTTQDAAYAAAYKSGNVKP